MDTFKKGLKAVFNPKRDFEEIATLKSSEKLLMVLMLLASILAYYFSGDRSILGLFTSIFTVLNLILIDRGRLTNYLWGILSCSVWLFVALENRLIGDIATQLFYFIMQFIGIYAWQKNLDADGQEEITPKKMTQKQSLVIAVITVILYFIMVYISKKANGNQVWLDSLILPMSIVAQILMTYGYRSQWLFWIVINIINVVIWAIQLHGGGNSALSMLVLNIMMLINSLYGLYVWYKHSDEVSTKE
jgi:nicotinamide mononucleotide transporter PnuC